MYRLRLIGSIPNPIFDLYEISICSVLGPAARVVAAITGAQILRICCDLKPCCDSLKFRICMTMIPNPAAIDSGRILGTSDFLFELKIPISITKPILPILIISLVS